MFPKDFPDSKIAKGFTFGRTKAVYALNSVFFFTFLSYWKTSDLHLVPKNFYGEELYERYV